MKGPFERLLDILIGLVFLSLALACAASLVRRLLETLCLPGDLALSALLVLFGAGLLVRARRAMTRTGAEAARQRRLERGDLVPGSAKRVGRASSEADRRPRRKEQ